MAANEKNSQNSDIVNSKADASVSDAKTADAKNAVSESSKATAVKAKKDKPKLTARIGKFFKDYKSELKKIVWYGRKDTINSSILVIICILIFGAITGALDVGFSQLIIQIGKAI